MKRPLSARTLMQLKVFHWNALFIRYHKLYGPRYNFAIVHVRAAVSTMQYLMAALPSVPTTATRCTASRYIEETRKTIAMIILLLL